MQNKCGRFSISAGENHLISQPSAASNRGVQATACLHCHFLACHLHPCESWGAFVLLHVRVVVCVFGSLICWFTCFGLLVFCFFSIIYDWFVVSLFLYLIVWIICWVVSNPKIGSSWGINCQPWWPPSAMRPQTLWYYLHKTTLKQYIINLRGPP